MKYTVILASVLAMMVGVASASPGSASLDQNAPNHDKKSLPPKYVMDVSGNGWNFLMGPAGAPKEALLFYHTPTRSGGVSIVCRRGMTDGVLIKLRNGAEPITKNTDVIIAIGSDRHNLIMHPGPNNSLIFQGPAGIAMLNAMAAIPEGRQADFTVSLKNGTILAQLPTPSISRFPFAAEKICSAWTGSY